MSLKGHIKPIPAPKFYVRLCRKRSFPGPACPCQDTKRHVPLWTLRALGVVTFRGPNRCLFLRSSLLRVRSLLSFLLRVLAHSAHDVISGLGIPCRMISRRSFRG